ncbi:MAG: L-glyceraldehyde 3-phosphate reductase [Bacteroidota bacterium]|nr:L-glyceraldehyde 3-phosphate reductase [Bacteroidota bacterium]
MSYNADLNRYENMEYRRCGNSGLKLPLISLGLWHNFGKTDDIENCRAILHTAFDTGITHFDLANNYGPPPGGAEETFGKIFKEDFRNYRDELIISSKAGWKMWDGPYGDNGSKKYLVASLDQSLKRMGLEYVDIFYHHRPDPETAFEETMSALDLIVRQGKALYVGISGYHPEDAKRAIEILRQLGTPCLIHQPKYSMLIRDVEKGLLDLLEKEKVGCIAFSSLAQGLLTNKYLDGIPKDSRAGRHLANGAITESQVTNEVIEKVKQLNKIAVSRNQTMAQMAISWVLKDKRITSIILGASKPQQVTDAVVAIKNYSFTKEELDRIDLILK